MQTHVKLDTVKLMSQKGFITVVIFYIIILFIILAIAVGVYLKPKNLPQPTFIQKPASTQSIYKDPDFNFSFNYPNSGYTIVSDDENKFFQRHGGDLRPGFISTWGYQTPKLIKGIVLENTSSSNIDLAPFTLWIYDNPEGLDAPGWYKKYWYYPFVWGDYEPRKDLYGPDTISSVSGQLAKSRIIDYQNPNLEFTYLSVNGKMYLFKIINQGDNLGKEIIKSFKL